MTKQHFVAFAEHIRIEFRDNPTVAREAAEMVADVARQFNGRFDRERFFAACGTPRGK